MLVYPELSDMVFVNITDEMIQRLAPIFERAENNTEDKRSQESKIKTGLEGLASEEGLVKLGFSKNPCVFDSYSPSTFNWDVSKNGLFYEVKRFNKSDNDTFCHYNRNAFKTFERYQKSVSGLIGTTIKWHGNDMSLIEIRYMFVVDPEMFFKHSYPSKFKDKYGEHNHYFCHTKVSPKSIWLNHKFLGVK